VHARQFASGLAHFKAYVLQKIAIMSHILKTVTHATMESFEAEYETDTDLSIGTMTFDLG